MRAQHHPRRLEPFDAKRAGAQEVGPAPDNHRHTGARKIPQQVRRLAIALDDERVGVGGRFQTANRAQRRGNPGRVENRTVVKLDRGPQVKTPSRRSRIVFPRRRELRRDATAVVDGDERFEDQRQHARTRERIKRVDGRRRRIERADERRGLDAQHTAVLRPRGGNGGRERDQQQRDPAGAGDPALSARGPFSAHHRPQATSI